MDHILPNFDPYPPRVDNYGHFANHLTFFNMFIHPPPHKHFPHICVEFLSFTPFLGGQMWTFYLPSEFILEVLCCALIDLIHSPTCLKFLPNRCLSFQRELENFDITYIFESIETIFQQFVYTSGLHGQ